MKKRQFLSALLAVSCAASMAVPASAAASDVTMADVVTAEVTGAGTYNLDVSASVQSPKLKVTLPTQTSVLVNPYRIEIKLNATETSFDTVLSPVMEVTNESTCAITIGVKGLLQTYAIVEDVPAAKWDAHEKVTVTGASVTGADLLKADADGFIYSSDLKNFYDSKGRQVTAKYTAEKISTKDGVADTPASLVISGYTASKTIKVATSAPKDVDTEKSNTLFMYVQGKQDGAEWAAFDSKATAANVEKPAGMMALSAKETSATILYLGGASGGTATKGQLRVTGAAATNPTTKWSEVPDKFDTIITFIVDPVANAAPKAPTVTDITLTPSTGSIGSTYTFAAATKEYTIEWSGASRNDGLTFAVVGADPADATVSYSATGAGITSNDLDMNATTGELTVKANPVPAAGVVADVTVKLTNKGETTTYVYHVTVKP